MQPMITGIVLLMSLVPSIVQAEEIPLVRGRMIVNEKVTLDPWRLVATYADHRNCLMGIPDAHSNNPNIKVSRKESSAVAMTSTI